MTNLGDLHHFLGISMTRNNSWLFLSQRQYAIGLLQRAGMSKCHPTATSVDAQKKLSATIDAPVVSGLCKQDTPKTCSKGYLGWPS